MYLILHGNVRFRSIIQSLQRIFQDITKKHNLQGNMKNLKIHDSRARVYELKNLLILLKHIVLIYFRINRIHRWKFIIIYNKLEVTKYFTDYLNDIMLFNYHFRHMF